MLSRSSSAFAFYIEQAMHILSPSKTFLLMTTWICWFVERLAGRW